MNILEKKTSQFNKRWHSSGNVFYHLDRLSKEIGPELLEKSNKYQKAREARIGAVMALVLANKRNSPAFLRLPLNDPPDIYLLQPSLVSKGTMDIITVEITKYMGGDTLLNQLKRTKKIDPVKYSKEYILLVEALTNEGIEHEKIKKYAQKQKIKYPIWILRKIQQSPDTIAEVVTIDTKIRSIEVNVGKEAFYFKKKYGKPTVVFAKRTTRLEKVRTEKNSGELLIAPWEQLED